MHLLLLIPSSILLGLLFFHSWRFRGRRVTLLFFGSCFVFGLVRGNLIHYICTTFLAESGLPYLFVKPAIKLWNASLQECIGWIFALYLSWSTVEWVLSRQGGKTVPLYRLIGLTAFFMGTVSYAVEAAAGGAKWWVWVLPYKNPFFADVPLVGIIAWISVVFDFLGPFLLIHYKVARSWWSRILLASIFPVHMIIHTKLSFDVAWLPQLGPPEIWHWLMICVLVWGIAEGGPGIVPWSARSQAADGAKSKFPYDFFISLCGFVFVLCSVHVFVMDSFDLAVSMVPMLTCILFFNPARAWLFCLLACLAYGLYADNWSYGLVPLLTALIFSFGGRIAGNVHFPSPSLRKRITWATLLLATVGIYLTCRHQQNHYDNMYTLGQRVIQAGTASELENRLAQLPSPVKPTDAGMYNLLADMSFGQQNYPAAKAFLERIIECNVDDPHAYSNLAIIYYLNQDYPAAIAALEKGLEVNPIKRDSYIILGEIYSGLDSLRKAELTYRRGLKFFKNDPEFGRALKNVRK